MEEKQPWQMSGEELRVAARGGKIDPFGGAEDEIAALCSGSKPVVFDLWHQAVDSTTFETIARAWLSRKRVSCPLYVVPIASEEGMIGLTIALSREAASAAAKAIVELPDDASYDARMGRLLGYSEADIAAWYLNMQGHVEAFLRFAAGDMQTAAAMFERFCGGLSLEQAVDMES